MKECDAESGDGAPLYTQHGRVERFSSGYWEYREVPASCAQVPREAREAPRRPPAPVELPLPYLCRWPPLSPPPSWADSSWPVFRLRCVCVCVGPVPVYNVLGFVRLAPCVGVNVNMTHATTGATTLLRHCYVVHTPYSCTTHDR